MNNDRVLDKQYGFTVGKSMQDAWLDVLNNENSIFKYVLSIFIDFVGAFDNITWSDILRELDFVKTRDSKLWKSYFSNP